MNTCIFWGRRQEIKRREYLALFEARMTIDPATGKEKRSSEYVVPWYVLSVDEARKGRECLVMLALWAVALAGFIVSGLSNASGSRCFYVLPFFLLLPFPLFYWALGILRLWRSPSRFTEVDKDEGYDRLRVSSLGAAALSGLHTAGEAVFLLLGGARGAPGRELLLMAAVLVLGLCALLTHRAMRPLEPVLQQKDPLPPEKEPDPNPASGSPGQG